METSNNINFKNFNFRLDCELFSAGFSEVSSLDTDIKNNGAGLDFSEIFSKQKKKSSKKSQKISLKRGLIDAESDFFLWIDSSKGDLKTLTLTLFENDNHAVVRWKISNAFPVNLEFNPSADKISIVEIEQLDLEFEDLTLEMI